MKKFALFSIVGLILALGSMLFFAKLVGKEELAKYLTEVVKKEMNCVNDGGTSIVPIKFSNIETVEVNSISTDAVIEFSDTDEIKIESADFNEEMTKSVISVQNQILKIDLANLEKHNDNVRLRMKIHEPFAINIQYLPLKIIIPQKIKNLKYKTVSGDLKIIGQLINSELETVSGDIKIRFNEGQKIDLDFSTVSGEISLREKSHDSAGGFSYESDSDQEEHSGNRKFNKTINSQAGSEVVRVKVKSISGDIKMRPEAESAVSSEENGEQKENEFFLICRPQNNRFFNVSN